MNTTDEELKSEYDSDDLGTEDDLIDVQAAAQQPSNPNTSPACPPKGASPLASRLLHRRNTMSRLSSIISEVNTWFMTDDVFAEKVNAFVYKHAGSNCCEGEEVFRVMTNTVGESNQLSGEVARTRKQIHRGFEELFESQLQGFLDARHVSADQLQAVFAIAQEEEAKFGLHFYRWVDATDYHVFLNVMHATCVDKKEGGEVIPIVVLRENIRERSVEAERVHRRSKLIRPLVEQHLIPSFAELEAVVVGCAEKPPMDKLQKKEMIRWSTAIKQKEKEQAQPATSDAAAHNEEWVRYVAKYAQFYGDDASFDSFAAALGNALEKHFCVSTRGKLFKAAWTLYDVANVHKYQNSTVDFRSLYPRLAKHFQCKKEDSEKGALSRARRKILVKWVNRLKSSSASEKAQPITFVQFHLFVLELVACNHNVAVTDNEHESGAKKREHDVDHLDDDAVQQNLRMLEVIRREIEDVNA
eukprot:PhM_4_TR16006/c0_g1_i1/m.54641